MDKSTALIVYKQTILPYFDYCGFLCEGAKKGHIKRFQTLQNRALRVCTRMFDIKHRTTKLHEECDIVKLKVRRENQLALFMYRIAAKLSLGPLEEPRTRGNHKIVFPERKPKLQLYKKSPIYRGLALWNRINPIVQQAKKPAIFKRMFGYTPLGPPIPET